MILINTEFPGWEGPDQGMMNVPRLRHLNGGKAEGLGLPEVNIELPVNFAFLLRTILGVTARAELVRVFMGSKEQPLNLRQLCEGAGASKRQVRRLLKEFHRADLISEARRPSRIHSWSSLPISC